MVLYVAGNINPSYNGPQGEGNYMWIDVQDWQRFFASSLGKTTIKLTHKTVHKHIPTTLQNQILGIGYPLPYLDMMPESMRSRCVAAMPSYLGAVPWPHSEHNRVVMVDETRLPFPDNFFDFIIVAHCLEFSGHQHSFLRELWRVLNNQGQIIIICANKLSLWSSVGTTPLARGGSFTLSQLTYLLQSNLYIPLSFEQALFIPPLKWCAHHKGIATLINKIMGRILPASGGILLAHAYKQTIIPPKAEKPPSWFQWLKGKATRASAPYSSRDMGSGV